VIKVCDYDLNLAFFSWNPPPSNVQFSDPRLPTSNRLAFSAYFKIFFYIFVCMYEWVREGR